MSKISIFIVTLFVAAVWCLPTADEDGVPAGHCHVSGLHIKEGETVPAPIGRCDKITCEDADKNHFYVLTCPESPGVKGCHKTPIDLTKPYPDCCPRSVCDDE